jgi:sporulation protein YlmC with PRC-barrel domain
MRVRLNQLMGRMVLDARGTVLGRIKAPLVDMETWLIDAVRVTCTRQTAAELGLAWSWLPWKRPTCDIPTGVVQAAGDAIILRISLGELHDALPIAVEEAVPALH